MVLFSMACARLEFATNQKLTNGLSIAMKIPCTNLRPIKGIAHRYGAHGAGDLLHSY